MSGKDGAPYFGEYEPDFFDLIIIDECHMRSFTKLFQYFNLLIHFYANGLIELR